MLLIPENIGDRKLSVFKTIRYQLNIEKKVYVFQESNISNVSILIDCQSYTFLLMNTVAELFRRRSLLRNSILVTSHLTVS